MKSLLVANVVLLAIVGLCWCDDNALIVPRGESLPGFEIRQLANLNAVEKVCNGSELQNNPNSMTYDVMTGRLVFNSLSTNIRNILFVDPYTCDVVHTCVAPTALFGMDSDSTGRIFASVSGPIIVELNKADCSLSVHCRLGGPTAGSSMELFEDKLIIGRTSLYIYDNFTSGNCDEYRTVDVNVCDRIRAFTTVSSDRMIAGCVDGTIVEYFPKNETFGAVLASGSDTRAAFASMLYDVTAPTSTDGVRAPTETPTTLEPGIFSDKNAVVTPIADPLGFAVRPLHDLENPVIVCNNSELVSTPDGLTYDRLNDQLIWHPTDDPMQVIMVNPYTCEIQLANFSKIKSCDAMTNLFGLGYDESSGTIYAESSNAFLLSFEPSDCTFTPYCVDQLTPAAAMEIVNGVLYIGSSTSVTKAENFTMGLCEPTQEISPPASCEIRGLAQINDTTIFVTCNNGDYYNLDVESFSFGPSLGTFVEKPDDAVASFFYSPPTEPPTHAPTEPPTHAPPSSTTAPTEVPSSTTLAPADSPTLTPSTTDAPSGENPTSAPEPSVTSAPIVPSVESPQAPTDANTSAPNSNVNSPASIIHVSYEALIGCLLVLVLGTCV